MAALNGQHGMTVSPNSSEEVESYQGTPATKLSPFTPEGLLRKGSKPIGLGISRSNKPSNVILFPLNGEAATSNSLRPHDPFTSDQTLTGATQINTAASKLSPNAIDFTPATLVDSGLGNFDLVNPKNSTPFPADSNGFRSEHGIVTLYSAGTDITAVISPYSPAVQHMPGSSPAAQGSASHLIGARVKGPFFKLGQFSSETGIWRCVVISEVVGKPVAEEIDEVFNVIVRHVDSWQVADSNQLREFPSRTHLFTGELAFADTVYLKFADRRDAETVQYTVDKKCLNWKTRFISPAQFAMKAEPQRSKHDQVSEHEGQVVVTATFVQNPRHADIDATGKFISNLVGNYGDVMVFEVRPTSALQILYRMELCDLRAAEKVLANLNDLKFDVSFHPPVGYLQKADSRRP